MPKSQPLGRATPDVLLAPFSAFLAVRLGLNFPRERWDDLERALRVAAKDFGFESVPACIQGLLASPLTTSQVEILASHLTVGETYFFRENAVFTALQEHILPDLIRNRAHKRLRIWSAGCSTGEEPYSIAIVLAQALQDLKGWDITLLASDINPRFLRKAVAGVYDNWSFRNAPAGLKAAYFRQTSKHQFEIAPQIKALPSYTHLNLADDVYPSPENNTNAMDIIFCRNVLMYFQPQRAQAVIGKLCRSLVEGGWLIVSPIETSQVNLPELTAVRLPDAILYRKDTHAVREDRPDPGQYPHPAGVRADGAAHGPAQTADANHAANSKHPAGSRPLDAAAAPPSAADADGEAALLARTYADQGRLADAIHWCNRAIAADKLNAKWPYLLASILHERGQTEEAVAALKRTLYLEQDHVMAHFALGSLLLQQGRRGESLRYFGNALAILGGYQQEQVLPESEGITAGRLIEIVKSTMANGISHEAQEYRD